MSNTTMALENDFLFYDVVSSTLLSFYLEIAYTQKHISTTARTKTLLKILKTLSQKSKFKPVKADIRRLIHFGRNYPLLLEKKMIEIHNLSEVHNEKQSAGTDLHSFHACLESMYKHEKSQSNNGLYFEHEQVLASFDYAGNSTRPVKVHIPSTFWSQAKRICQKNGWQLANKGCSKQHITGELCR